MRLFVFFFRFWTMLRWKLQIVNISYKKNIEYINKARTYLTLESVIILLNINEKVRLNEYYIRNSLLFNKLL